MVYVLIFLIFGWNTGVETSDIPDDVKQTIVSKVNEVRSKGCRCGGKYMPPVGPVTWNDQLYTSALSHAQDMYHNRFFDHYSSKGHDIGQRLDQIGYYWQHAGENLGEGQRTFDEVMKDWKASPSHCEMLMNPKVKEVAVARYKKYWVQHFGTRIPEGAVRVNKRKN